MSLVGLSTGKRWRKRLALLRGKQYRDFLGLGARRAQLWLEFFWDLTRTMRTRPLVLVPVQAWHLGWHYQARRETYLRHLNAAYLRVDLYSSLQVHLAWRFMGRPKPLALSAEEIEMWARSKWDTRFWYEESLPCSVNDYETKRMQLIAPLAPPRHADKVKGMLSNRNECDGLAITEAGLEDWPWAISCVEVGNRLIEFEGKFGSTVRSALATEIDAQFVRSIANDLTETELKRAQASLEERTRGRYSDSHMGNYMSDLDVTPGRFQGVSARTKRSEFTPILFLHCFGDAANAGLYPGEYPQSLDYLEMTLRVMQSFVEAKRELLIRFHPAHGRYRGDREAEACVMRHVLSSKYLEVVSSDLPILELEKHFGPRLIAISGRGSVLLEAAYMGIPSASLMDNLYVHLSLSRLITSIEGLPGAIESLARVASNERTRAEAIRVWGALERIALTGGFYRLSDYNRAGIRTQRTTYTTI